MPHHLQRRRSVARTIRELARAELGEARDAIGGGKADPARTVHDVRQRLKRLRALLRLLRGHLPQYARENETFRDLGRRLARIREREVLAKTYDEIAREADPAPPEALRAAVLAARTSPTVDLESVLAAEIEPALAAAARRVGRWRFGARGFDLIADGLERTYRQLRARGLEAAHVTNAATLHEWRKRVKYHAAQLKLLAPVDPEWVEERRRMADALAEVLGDHHDLDALAEALRGLALEAGQGREPLLMAIAERGAALEREAFRLGDALTADSPAAFRRRLANAWHRWRD